MIVYVSIGNSDDKLSQAQWAQFCMDVYAVLAAEGKLRGAWYSASNSMYQNACWCVEIVLPVRDKMMGKLMTLAEKYKQDSIAWAEAPVTRYIGHEDDE